MALTFTFDSPHTIVEHGGAGPKQGVLTGTVTFDSSYATGGELATDLSAKFKKLNVVLCDNANGDGFWYDRANNKIKVFTATATEASGDLSTLVANFVAYGFM